MSIRQNRTQPLLDDTVPLQISITHLRVLQGRGLGQDVTHEIDLDELLSLLAESQIRRDRNAWSGTLAAEWEIEILQAGNQFHRTMSIALGETHGMMTERGFREYLFSISNGDEILAFLEQAIAEQ